MVDPLNPVRKLAGNRTQTLGLGLLHAQVTFVLGESTTGKPTLLPLEKPSYLQDKEFTQIWLPLVAVKAIGFVHQWVILHLSRFDMHRHCRRRSEITVQGLIRGFHIHYSSS